MKKKTSPDGSSNRKERESGRDVNNSFIEEVVSIRRVAKVIKGGRRLMFSAFVVVGDGAGKVGLGSGKGREVAPAVSKAFKRAKKNLVSIPLQDSTVPFDVAAKFGASKVMMRAARKGTGVIAGGAVRLIMSAVGIKDILAKSLGASNPINVSYATVKALQKLSALNVVKQIKSEVSIKDQGYADPLVLS